MFLTLNYDVQFYTGRCLCNELTFDTGLTAIYGANESGKSFVLEMLRFMLFGTQALRGKAEDYKRLVVKGTFNIKEETYQLERTLRRAELKRGQELIATGVTAVNHKIVGLLGFGLPVFDVACAANQGDLTSLTDMRPTDRKRMVDTIVGIGAFEVVGKWASAEASLADREAQAIMGALTAPVAPEMPEGYQPSNQLGSALEAAEDAAKRLSHIEGWLAQNRKKPASPQCTVNMDTSVLERLATQRRSALAESASLKAQIQSLPERAPCSIGQIALLRRAIEGFQSYREAQSRISSDPRPKIEQGRIDSLRSQWKVHDDYTQRLVSSRQLKHQLDRLKKHTLECPECEHKWYVDQVSVDSLSRDLAALDLTEVPEPNISKSEIDRAEAFYSRWEAGEYEKLLAVPAVADPKVTHRQIDQWEGDIGRAKVRADLEVKLKQLEPEITGPDFEQMLFQRRAYDAAVERYLEEQRSYEVWLDDRMAKVLEKSELEEKARRVPALRQEFNNSLFYERDLKQYGVQNDIYVSKMVEVNQLQASAEQYRRVAEAMKLLRQRVKQYLLPSLNRVASHLLSRMTAGSRTTVFVDEDFEILIDGQRVDTLSGSARVCANLALRIALGQVLVNQVFSVFLGDELDGSMDAVRAVETAQTLRVLKSSISQILIVSHKHFEADNDISLGEINVDDTLTNTGTGASGQLQEA